MNKNYLKYNNLGILADSNLKEVSQGNKNVDYYYIAYDVYDYTNCFLDVSITLPDGTNLPEIPTSPNDFEFKESKYKGFMFKLTEPLTSIAGILTMTFNLKSLENDTQLCSSQLKIEIHGTDTPTEPTITELQYNQMQESIRDGFAELNSQYEKTWETITKKVEEEGLKGDAATIKLGSVATGKEGTDVIITNTGTESDAVFNFVIPRGEKGAKGDKGEQGIQGIQGPKGERGENGTSFKITGEVDAVGNLPMLTEKDAGTAYFVGTENPKEVYLWVYKDGVLQWVQEGQLQGPEGPQGPQGIQGPEGPKGDTGEAPSDYVRCVDAFASPEPDIDPFGNYYNKSQIDSKLSNLTSREYVDTGLGLKQNTLIAGKNISIANDGKTISANVPEQKKPLKQIYNGDLAINPTSGATIPNLNLTVGKVYVFEGSGIYAIVKATSTSIEISGTTCYGNEFRFINYRIFIENNGSNLEFTSNTNSFNVEEGTLSNNETNNTTLYIRRIYEMEVE